MKKIILILVMSLLLYNPSSFAVIKGKGEVKMSDDAVNHFIQYIRGKIKDGRRWKPAVFILSSNGEWHKAWYCPYNECIENERKTVEQCERDTGVKCGVFAFRRTIYWENGINTKKNKTKFKKRMSDEHIKSELTRLGFYGETTSGKSKVTKKDNSKNKDIVAQLKTLKKLYDDGVLTKEEFEKAKKKILN
tara:strand:- start:802 stop:1374 length:573 start_codon:yes stop_codon:yes gene_type:complete